MNAATVTVFVVMVIAVPLALNEAGELAPWLAGFVVRRAASFLGSAEARERYEEEWLANLERVPGKLTKVAWAIGLLTLAVPQMRWQIRSRRQHLARAPGPLVQLQSTVPRQEVEMVIRALLSAKGGSAGVTTALRGGGGFGKTSIAQTVCTDARIRRHFGDRVYWVSLGAELRSAAQIAAKVSEVNVLITGEDRQFADPYMAGIHLSARLSALRRPVLLVLDDAWDSAQLAPFLLATPNCARLITTRIASIVPADAVTVLVDRMDRSLAAAVLTMNLPAMPADLVDDLVEACGGWALLLRLANRLLAEQLATGGNVADLGQAVLDQLISRSQPGSSKVPFNIADPRQRSETVEASILASVSWLPTSAADRFWELGVFPEDDPLPIRVLGLLWAKTAGFDQAETRRTCRDLQRLSLIDIDPAGGGTVLLHGVLHAYARSRLGPDRVRQINQQLVDGIEAALPSATPLTAAGMRPRAAWWQLDRQVDSYLLDHAIGLLLAAGEEAQAATLAADVRWVAARLCQHGVAAAINDLDRAGGETANQSSDPGCGANTLTVQLVGDGAQQFRHLERRFSVRVLAAPQRVRGVVEHLDDVLDDDYKLLGGLAHGGDGRTGVQQLEV